MTSPLIISKASPLAQITIAAASFTNSYTVGGTFTKSVQMMFITSTLDEAVQLSLDGTTDWLAIPAGDTVPVFIPLNFNCNRLMLPKPTIYIKEIGNPTTGSLYISAFTNS